MGYLRSCCTFDKYFAETHTYRKAKDYLEKYNIVVLIGPPGCGKTQIANHLMFQTSFNRTVHKIRSWEEFLFTDPKVQSLVFIDNIFYDNILNYDMENWWKTLEDCFNNCARQGREGVTTGPIDPLKVIITAREHVIEKACSFMETTTPLFNEKYIISGNSFRYNDREKELIFRKQMEYAEKEKHIPSHRITEQFLIEIKSSEGPIAFPFCAHLYACKEEYKSHGTRFFSHPTEFLKLQTEFEIENDKSCKTKTLFFVLFLFEWHLEMCDPHKKLDLENEALCREFVNSYSPDAMQIFSPLDFKGLSPIARKLTGPFFIEIEKGFKFVHDSVYEAVGDFFCEKYFDQTTQLHPLDVISNHDYSSLTEKQTKTLASRFLYEALNQNLSKIFTCDIFKKKSFVETFCDELSRKGENVVRCFLMIENDSSSVKLPSIFWTSRCSLPYLTDLLYEMILKERKIDADYHMYLSLFGECCARNEHLLGTINGMLRNDLEEIKKRVLMFVDDEGNSVLHIIIMSDRSDACVAQAVKKITEAGVSVNRRNDMKITPLMVAVKHCGPRKDVIRQLCEQDLEIKLRDTNCSSVFHHCLSSENDDETCLEYLTIILEKAKNKRILNESDDNGENALNMAAKQSRYSRILCILTLMGIEEVKATIDLDGNTPIHNAIKHLKGKNKNPLLARLECSVRIILFIACGVDPDQIADDKKRPIDLCNDECVKRILEALPPWKVAEKVFITLLNEIELKYEKKEIAGHLEFPAKIPNELKSHIEKAVKYLRHADFDKAYMNT